MISWTWGSARRVGINYNFLEPVTEALNAMGIVRPVLQLGLPDVFIEHGDPAKLLALQGLDAAGIRASITARFLPGNAG